MRSSALPRPGDRVRRRWKFSALNLITAVAVLAGITLLTYPTAAAWVSQYNQSNVIFDQTRANSEKAQAELDEQLADAREYNSLLESGALLRSGANVAEGVGTIDTRLDYWNLLDTDPTRTMGRVSIPSIGVDLPVYHGTSEATLLKGIGHLEGTSLPVGGAGTRSVLTGHRGLASATMFTDLDQVENGDTFSVEVLGEVLTYRVFSIEVVEPDATEEIRPVPGKDLMTLVTCTPLGINTHRILITGERVLPTPQDAIDSMTERPDIPGFPWWLVLYTAGVAVIVFWYGRSGFPSRKGRESREHSRSLPDAATEVEASADGKRADSADSEEP